MVGWVAAGHPHPFIRLGGLARFFQHLNAGFVGLQVSATVLHFPDQLDQGFEYVIETDDPVRHAGAAEILAQTSEHLLLTVQRQTIGVF